MHRTTLLASLLSLTPIISATASGSYLPRTLSYARNPLNTPKRRQLGENDSCGQDESDSADCTDLDYPYRVCAYYSPSPCDGCAEGFYVYECEASASDNQC
jgi:hypothetical protein